MAQWRIRVMVPEAPSAQQVLTTALSQVPVTGVRLEQPAGQPGDGAAGTTSDVIVELGSDAALADLLRTLHEISPQVFISRVPSPETAGDQQIRVRRLAPGSIPR